jgi:anti-anti-sigma factor
MYLNIAHHTEDSILVIVLTGRLLLGPEGAELEVLVGNQIAAGVRNFVFDFAHLTHIDSTGIGRCIASLNQIMQAGGQLGIAGAMGQVRESFRVTQLDRVFRFYPDTAAAKAAVAA